VLGTARRGKNANADLPPVDSLGRSAFRRLSLNTKASEAPADKLLSLLSL
jgi:hypothetical protein